MFCLLFFFISITKKLKQQRRKYKEQRKPKMTQFDVLTLSVILTSKLSMKNVSLVVLESVVKSYRVSRI